ncbi:pyrroline-5-carboxylate reductase [Loigolactobacillus backii]|uniref:pyrroline-5-carboxylate reductase n=1 Tax=Loigolactobacillus backii TaxID=375175 RepID=UPI0007F1600F|nr:pyrroline-5-carboxylate reductase [Loigolactobacillus backii]ANK59012.1 pyrroline-5-carboxylate reductase [Loigolactobacillus backii]ANK64000.1 pyrroline-5-carboxylate reductase [Loigolactobacillus backii]ANK66449.1 pyrroline-5-carboxylate reductase [Loigolactobacillus backii]OLF69835.1 pyrroline-5-carboxylate reductase [Loigolactobacillus backii]PIO88359.1 pyrroline-5-carboxylate reductase [Loigolactobacillus backii]
MKIGFIGAGHMAQAMMAGLVAAQFNRPSDILVHSAHKAHYQPFAKAHQYTAVASNQALVTQSDVVILAATANVSLEIIASLQKVLEEKTPLLISVAGGVTLSALADAADNADLSIMRAMPNVNVAINQGMTALVANEVTPEADLAKAKAIFAALGKIQFIAEKDFTTFAAIAGSAPAYAYLFIDALSRAGVKHGLNKTDATKIAAQTVLGSAANLLATEENPWNLIDQVSSPGGTTVAGLLAMEEAGLMTAVVKGIDATIGRE